MPTSKATTEPDPLPVSKAGVIVAEGFGLRLYVRHGVLYVEDGQGQNGRRARLVRSAARGKRVVLLGRAGSISVEALRWMADAGAGFALVDAAAGTVTVASAGPGTNLPALRRSQALAGTPGSEVGLAVTRHLIGTKLEGQAGVLTDCFKDQERATALLEGAEQVASASHLEVIRGIEARVAADYWERWTGIELTFARRDEPRIPSHWRTFEGRSSEVAQGPRSATRPLNSVINYLTALAEIECSLALLAVGLDPGLGILHTDQRARDSMALDLIEVLRPDVDRYVLALIAERVFAKAAFYETRRGVFRVGVSLAHELAETLPTWRHLVAPHAEEVARLIAGGSPRALRLATPLTQSNLAASRVRRTEPTRRTAPFAKAAKTCRGCGGALPSRRRTWCDECGPQALRERAVARAAAGRAAQAKMRAEGRDPTHGGEARRKHSERARIRRAELASWRGPQGDPELFKLRILPGLRLLSIRQISVATGLSPSYAADIRNGNRVPHPRWWRALALVGDGAGR